MTEQTEQLHLEIPRTVVIPNTEEDRETARWIQELVRTMFELKNCAKYPSQDGNDVRINTSTEERPKAPTHMTSGLFGTVIRDKLVFYLLNAEETIIDPPPQHPHGKSYRDPNYVRFQLVCVGLWDPHTDLVMAMHAKLLGK